MDCLKLFGKNDYQIDSLVQTVFTFSEDIGMEFGLKKCGKKQMRMDILTWYSSVGQDKRTQNED